MMTDWECLANLCGLEIWTLVYLFHYTWFPALNPTNPSAPFQLYCRFQDDIWCAREQPGWNAAVAYCSACIWILLFFFPYQEEDSPLPLPTSRMIKPGRLYVELIAAVVWNFEGIFEHVWTTKLMLAAVLNLQLLLCCCIVGWGSV